MNCSDTMYWILNIPGLNFFKEIIVYCVFRVAWDNGLFKITVTLKLCSFPKKKKNVK